MAPGHTITITPSSIHVEVLVNGLQVAESDRPTLLDETGMPTRYYLPLEDVRDDLLQRTNFHTTCPFKGEATYWSLALDEETLDGIVWTYEEPIAGAEAITGLLCFFPERVEMRVGAADSSGDG